MSIAIASSIGIGLVLLCAIVLITRFCVVLDEKDRKDAIECHNKFKARLKEWETDPTKKI